MSKLQLPIHSYAHLSKPVGVERLVNALAEQAPTEGKGPVALMRPPGIETFASVGTGPGRGCCTWNSMLYVVSGRKLYAVPDSAEPIEIGTVEGLFPVTWAQNEDTLVICDRTGVAYTYDGTTFSEITDPDWENGVQCASLDNYILFRRGDTGQFFSSDIGDATSYDALYYATAEGAPDKLNGLIVDHRQVVLAGPNSIELWNNQGGTDFPFGRDANGFVEIGCANGWTLAKVDNSIYWLASDLTVRRLEGLTPFRVSQHGVEQAISKYDNISDAYGFGYTFAGHVYYVLQFPSQNATWVFDATTREWHERRSDTFGRWRGCASTSAYGATFIQDAKTGKVGYLDLETYTEFGEAMRFEATFPSVYVDGKRVVHSLLQVMVEGGVGNADVLDPTMTLEKSDDSGMTWQTLATRSLGLQSRFLTRVRWNRLGSARDRVYRISNADPCKLVIADAQVDVTEVSADGN